MFGLSDQDVNASYTALDYAIDVRTDKSLAIYENGTVKATFTNAYKRYDVIRIERVGTAVKYLVNNVEIYPAGASVTQTPSNGILMVDISLYSASAAIAEVRTSFSGSTYTINRRFEYDHAGRMKTTWHQLDAQPEIALISNTYNELGQLIDKKLHSTVSTGTDAKQSVDYRYNIRGWLTSINNATLSNDATNDDSGDLFGMNLGYNIAFTGLNDLPADKLAFNGNISATRWSRNLGLGTEKEQGYTYTYDAMNRLLSATHKTSSSLNSWSAGNYNEDSFEYDLNGNIKKLKRGGEAGALIDDLTYNYTVAAGNVGNKLLSVTDAAPALSQPKGFKDDNITSAADDYTYDANGNMTRDLNKGIGVSLGDVSNFITYNFLNLPEVVTKSVVNSVRYIYDATGRKVCQMVVSGNVIKQTDYAGEFQYENGVLQFLNHEEGRIVMAGRKLIFSHNGETTAGVTASNATLATVTQNGEEKYIKATSDGTVVRTGISNVGGILSVTGGERYIIRAKCYKEGANLVYLLIKVGGVDVSASHITPNSMSTESWIEQIVAIPGTAGNTLEAGLVWNTVTAGEILYLNEFEIIKLESAAPEYQYHLKDHLGNVRLTFTSRQETESATATFEEVNKTSEQGKFLRYINAKRVYSPLFDHTNGAADGYAQRLAGGENEKYGLGKSLSVMPGDVINMEVYAKYIDAQTSNHTPSLTTLLSNVAANAAGVVYVDGGGYAVSTSSFIFGTQSGTIHQGTSGTGPKAYLNWLVFDRNYNLIPAKSGYKRMTTAAREYGQDAAHELLNGQITVAEPGYVYIYISNEEDTNPYEVYFDDFKVEHIKSPVVQMDDYYPFGLTFNSYQRENGATQDFKYNGNELQTELGLQWIDYGFRMYNPEIGRWSVLDALTEKHKAVSPYVYVLNNPMLYIDVLGLDTLKEVVVTGQRYEGSPNWYFFMQNLGDAGYHDFIYELYQHKLDAYRTALGAGLYGRNSHGDVLIPEVILDREYEEAEEEALPLLAALWAMDQSGVDPNSVEYLFNPLAQSAFLTSYLQTAVSKEEASKIVTSVGIQVGLAWLGSINIKSPNSFFVNRTKSNGGGITVFQVKSGKKFRVDFDRVNKIHYHRRGLKPGQGIGRHRPWEKKATDKSFWDRF
jgi:RHS repeat-associated protein